MNKAIILHVEDDEGWLQDVKRYLEKDNNYFYIYASTLEQAKNVYGELALEGKAPDVIILDISLVFEDKSDLSGLNFLEALESFGFTNKTSIIVLSGNINVTVLIELFEKHKLSITGIFQKGDLAEKQADFLSAIKRAATHSIRFGNIGS